jgi:ubiquinol-cytochrome c reductase subunit 7
MLRPLTQWASQRYTAGLADKLKDYGLRYDDLYDPLMDADVAEALRRLPDEVVFARNARLRRAMDLSLKHEKLPKELRDRQTPFEQYLTVSSWFCGLFAVLVLAPSRRFFPPPRRQPN